MIKRKKIIKIAIDSPAAAGAGTLAKEIHQGQSVGILDLTRGELGTRGSAEIRDKESATAAKILNIKVRENLSFSDGFFINDKHHQIEIIKLIRKSRT